MDLPVAFTTPILLAAFILLPGLWWLLRVAPPAPQRISFPAIRLLQGLATLEDSPIRTPLWLVLLRMLLAALLILGFTGPVWHPAAVARGSGPLVIVVDDDWAAAPQWTAWQQAMASLAGRTARDGRRLYVLTTTAQAAPLPSAAPLIAYTPARAAETIAALQPHPWAADHTQAARRLAALPDKQDMTVWWFSDGLADDGTPALIDSLGSFKEIHVVRPAPLELPLVLTADTVPGSGLALDLHRAVAGVARTVSLQAKARDGAVLGIFPASFGTTDTDLRLELPLPLEARNRVTHIDVTGGGTAASVQLVDSSTRRASVGIVRPPGGEGPEPLLSATHYLRRALDPFATIRDGSVANLLNAAPSMLLLNDGTASSQDFPALARWVEHGGMLVRFAGPNLAQAPDADDLLPITLRSGGREIGGAMSWEKPTHLAPFPARSPFAGLDVPHDVTVSRQVLAEPSADLETKTWAALADGTPLVTAARRGQGWIVLFHVTADTSWTSLPLSGLFVEMLHRLTSVDAGLAAGKDGAASSLPPWRTLDGFGLLADPPPTAAALAAGPAPAIDALHPPGLYGSETRSRALNLGSSVLPLTAIDTIPDAWITTMADSAHERALQPFLLLAALLLLIVDMLIDYAMRGLLPLRLLPALIFILAIPGVANAQDDARAITATEAVHLGYIVTGDTALDETSRAGLDGLDHVLAARTAIEPGDPVAIDPERDDMVLYPLIYWPLAESQPALSPAAIAHVNAYLATGGILLIDTRDANLGLASDTASRLDTLLAGVRLPALEPLPADHPLNRAFYLLKETPGRWRGGTLWVEPPDARVNDGVSTLVLGGNDWAAAWAVDASGDAEYSPEPGGEAQQEAAYRFGVNLVMYALTGSYKSDQMQVRAILDRLNR